MSNETLVILAPQFFPMSSVGAAVGAGSIYVGEPDTDPTIVGNQKTVYALQEDGSLVAISQPITLSGGGIPLYDGSPVALYITGDYSLTVLDINDAQVYYIPSTPGIYNTPAEWTGQQNFNEIAITSADNAVIWDLDLAQCAVHVLTENTTISAPTNMHAGGTYVLRVVQAAGVYSLDFNAVFEWGTEDDPVAPAANADYIVLSFYCDGTNMIGAEFVRVEA